MSSPGPQALLQKKVDLLRKNCLQGLGDFSYERGREILATNTGDVAERKLEKELGSRIHSKWAGILSQIVALEEQLRLFETDEIDSPRSQDSMSPGPASPQLKSRTLDDAGTIEIPLNAFAQQAISRIEEEDVASPVTFRNK